MIDAMKYLMLVAALMPAMTAFSQDEGFVINGAVEGMESGEIFFQRSVKYKLKMMDTVEVTDGKFSLEGYVEQPELFYFTFTKKGKVNYPIFLENSEIDIVIDKNAKTVSSVTGSEHHDIYAEFNSIMNAYNTTLTDIRNNYNKALASQDQAAAKDYSDQFNNVNLNTSEYLMNFILGKPMSAVNGYAAVQYGRDEKALPFLIQAKDSFDIYIPESKYTGLIGSFIKSNKKLAIGEVAPDIAAASPEGDTIHISDFQGKLLLVDFWASWCGPCRKENPNVVALYEEYKDKGFEILGVSLDSKRANWLKAIDDDGLTWSHISDLKGWKCEPCKPYRVNSIPFTVLLDEEGKIIAKNLRGQALHDKVASILDSP